MHHAKCFMSLAALLALSSQASAFDCSKATTDVEKAICGDSELRAQDAEMTEAYLAVRNASSAEDRKQLTLSQKRWITYRDGLCPGDGTPEQRKCIHDEVEKRLALLKGKPLSGPGYDGQLIPVLLQREGTRTTYDLDYTLFKFANPKSKAERLLNAQADKILKAAPRGKQEEFDRDVARMSSATFNLSYASPRLLSVEYVTYEDNGGAHGYGATTNINIDMQAGKLVRMDQLFDASALDKLTNDCRDQVIKAKLEHNSDEPGYDIKQDSNFNESTIADFVRDQQRWTFTADKAIVTFNQYDVGAYVEGPYSCEFAEKDLRMLTGADTPLP